MPVIISHNSALELLRAVPPQVRAYPRVCEALDMELISTDSRELRRLDLSEFGVRRAPVHVLAAKGVRAIQSKAVETHNFGLPVMPEGLLLELAPGVYAAGPEPIIQIMTKIHQSCIMSAPTTSQYAAITALRHCDDQIEAMRDEYNRRRRYVVKALNEMGLTCFEPRGAFYVFPSIQVSGLTSEEFCERLLREKEVAIIPGDAFGASGEGYARISYAYSVDHLQTAMHRIREFLQDNGWLKA